MMRRSIYVTLLVLSFGVLAVASEDTAPITIGGKIHASVTRLELEDVFRVFTSSDRIVIISLTNAFGYAEHIATGRVINESTGHSEKVVFFQTFRYDPKLKETHAIRKRVYPKKKGEADKSPLANGRIKEITKIRNNKASVHDGTFLRIIIWENEKVIVNWELKTANFEDRPLYELWRKDIEQKFSFQFLEE